MLIDAHLHIGLNDWTEERLLHYLDENDIEKAWLLTWDEMDPLLPLEYQPLDIELVRKAFKQHPDRIVPFYAPDPARPDWKEELKRCLDEGFAGCAELKVTYNWDDPNMLPLLEFLDSNGLPLVFHMERARKYFVGSDKKKLEWLLKRLINTRYNGVQARRIENFSRRTGVLRNYLDKRTIEFPGYLLDFESLEKAVAEYKNISFIGHGPHIWNHYAIVERDYLFHQCGKIKGKGLIWRLLEAYENFHCDISGFSGYNAMNRDHRASKEFLSLFHEKILFGTDNYELGLHKLLESFNIDVEKKANIYYNNARRIAG